MSSQFDDRFTGQKARFSETRRAFLMHSPLSRPLPRAAFSERSDPFAGIDKCRPILYTFIASVFGVAGRRLSEKDCLCVMNQHIKNRLFAALCLALCMVLPFLIGQIPEIGKRFSPMHIPVFICGFVCGWPWGLAVGAIAPLLRSTMFGVPAMGPDAFSMMFELAAYGAVSGILYRVFPKKPWSIYVVLVIAMIVGRLVWGAAKWAMLGPAFTLKLFLAGAIVKAIPGIILHIVLIPPIILALQRAGFIENDREVHL